MVRNMVSKPVPDIFSRWPMSLLSIIPGMPEPDEWPMPGIEEDMSLPQDFNQPFMVRISGSCAFSTREARSLTLAEEARPAASFAISRACWWWGITPCANDTPWALCARAAVSAPALADDDAEVSLPALPLLSLSPLSLPQAARTSAA